MKKRNIQLMILLSILSMFSGHDLIAQEEMVSPPPTNLQYLTSATWQLKEIQVDTNYYYDQAIPVLKYTFNTVGNVTIVADTSSATVPWKFSSTDPNQIILNEGPYEQIFQIQFLNGNIFIYKADYDIEGTVYNYIFKFISI